ncbi:10647_t:CDS:2 [Dentiscutata erythropus]|uniref:10647_t:CDS:1 n=1 Tax=Dentiscutata erythropus TaxID=1348616 RepID=A0A9N9BED7_9GLOM|nr:10647_t:CDS:2 [Dentiscutata erythropus]
MIKFVLVSFTILSLFLSITNCQLENDQITDISAREPWLIDDHFPSPFDEFMNSKQNIHSDPFQVMDELVDLSIEATEAMLDSLDFNNLNDENSFTTIEITIVESPDLPETKTVAAFAAITPVILSMIRGKKEKKYEYFVVHATDDYQTTDLESAMCVKK